MSGVIEDYHQALMTERDKVRRLEEKLSLLEDIAGASAKNSVAERDALIAERDRASNERDEAIARLARDHSACASLEYGHLCRDPETHAFLDRVTQPPQGETP